MHTQNSTLVNQRDSILSTHTVLRNTYMLLGLTLLFSGAIAYFSMVIGAQPVGPILMIAGFFGLMLLTQALRNSAWGLVAVFAFTGFMGYTLGPMLNMFMHTFSNGAQMITTALVATGGIFLGLSAYVLTTKKDFSYMGGFLTIAMIAVMVGLILAMFMPALTIFMSMAVVVIMSAMILFQTSMIINGGERNYISATVSLYLSLYNLFIHLLNLFAILSGRD